MSVLRARIYLREAVHVLKAALKNAERMRGFRSRMAT